MKSKLRIIFISIIIIIFVLLVWFCKYASVENTLIFSGNNSENQIIMNSKIETEIQKNLTHLKTEILNTWELSQSDENKYDTNIFMDEDFDKILTTRNEVTSCKCIE